MSWWRVSEFVADVSRLLPILLPALAAGAAAVGVRRWRRAPVAAAWLVPAAACLTLAAVPPAADRLAGAEHTRLIDRYHAAYAARLEEEPDVDDGWALMYSDDPTWFAGREDTPLAADLERLWDRFEEDQAALDWGANHPLLAPLRAAGWPNGRWWSVSPRWPGVGPAALWLGTGLCLLAAGTRGRRWRDGPAVGTNGVAGDNPPGDDGPVPPPDPRVRP